MYRPDIEWLLIKGYQALEEKVKEKPISNEDIKMAYEIYIRPRLEKMSFADDFERRQVEDYILSKLSDRSKQLNSQQWGKPI